MRRKDTVDIKRRAILWAIYEVTEEGLELNRKEETLHARPDFKSNQVAAPNAQGPVVFTMKYDEFVKNATKSEFIKEEI